MKNKPILFARIADMEYYRGITETDKPRNGGSYVKETGEANECFNFDAVVLDGEKVCLGFVMQSAVEGHAIPQIHIEKIEGCASMKKAEQVEGVTVVFCALPENGSCTRVLGYYKNATAFRYRQFADFTDDNGELSYVQEFSFLAKAEDCVLLPRQNRKWLVPRSRTDGYDFGMGRSNIWFASGADTNPKLRKYLDDMLEKIENYNGRNLLEEEAE